MCRSRTSRRSGCAPPAASSANVVRWKGSRSGSGPRRPGRRWSGYHEDLRVLDVDGREITRVPFGLDITCWHPSALGEGLFDIVFDQSSARNRTGPRSGARPVWNVWQNGIPRRRDLWATLDEADRRERFELTRPVEGKPAGGLLHVHGRHATDETGMYLALGEAVAGPGLNFGAGLDHLETLLHGLDETVTLVWHDTDVALSVLGQHFVNLVNLLRAFMIVRLEPDVVPVDRRAELAGLARRWQRGRDAVDGVRSSPRWYMVRTPDVDGCTDWLAVEGIIVYPLDYTVMESAPARLTVPTDNPDEIAAQLEAEGMDLQPKSRRPT